MKQYDCILCNKRTKPKNRRIIYPLLKRFLTNKLLIDNIKSTDVVCNTCMHRYYYAETQNKPQLKRQGSAEDENDPNYNPPPVIKKSKPELSPPSVLLKIPSTSSSHARCVICKKPGPKLVVITPNTRFQAFIDGNILIAAGARCCSSHLDEKKKCLKRECFDILATTENSFSNRTYILNLLEHLRNTCIRKHSNIDFDSIEEDDCKNLTGLLCHHFEDLMTHVFMHIKSTPSRTPRTSVGIFLMKMKCALSNRILSTLFKISLSSVRRAIHTVREALMRSFVPLYLGFESITREDIITKHTRPIAKNLLKADDDAIILVLDGTYIYVQKSNNFSFQRRSFSLHKSRPLVKPMVVVTSTGYFVDIMGPYLAKNNDASILNHMLKANIDDIKGFVQDNDIFVVDRGFRDSLSLLEDLGIKSAMPAFMKKGEKQMSDSDANTSRLVTKIRWVVESANARIKNFKYLDRVLPTNQVPFIGDYVRIVCAISNKYFPPLSSAKSVEDDKKLAEEMQEKSKQINELKEYVMEKKFERRSANWIPIENMEIVFPKLSEEHLRAITCGVYQLKLGPSYIQEYVEGDSQICVHRDEPNLLRVRIQSRHVSAKKYLLWIKYSDIDIISWYCTCRAGARVVGVCAHVAAILWYMSGARETRESFGVKDWGEFLSDASKLPETIDTSESETESVVSVLEE